MVETTDLIFAVDSTRRLRRHKKPSSSSLPTSLPSLLALALFRAGGCDHYFRYPEIGLSGGPYFIGEKCLLTRATILRVGFPGDIPTSHIAHRRREHYLISMIASVISAQREEKRRKKQAPEDKPKDKTRRVRSGVSRRGRFLHSEG